METQPINEREYECECNDCGWQGNKEDLEGYIDDGIFDCCPKCGSDNIYYF
jgi:Zn finger protein HypA/HybF involved in hydrogenase expression